MSQPAMLTTAGATTPAVWRVIIPGDPRPKGDMLCIGKRGRVNHKMVWKMTPEGKAWRKQVTAAAADLAARIGHPLDEPVGMGLLTVLPRGKTVTRALPTTRNDGDVDKLARMDFDALTDGGAIADDGRIVALLAFKVYEAPGRPVGAHIYLTTPGPGRYNRILDAILATAPELDQLN